MVIKRIAILFSGNGSNLENLLEKLHKKTINGINIEVALILCNNPNAYGIIRSRKFGIEPVIVNHRDFLSRESFDEKIAKIIQKENIDLTILAGFMRILSKEFTSNIKAINVHPSLLPLFKGAHAIKESYDSDMKIGGVSVHFVSEELDGGKIIAQKAFEKTNDMSFEKFEEKIHEIEYEILPQTVIEILTRSS